MDTTLLEVWFDIGILFSDGSLLMFREIFMPADRQTAGFHLRRVNQGG
jgi:hypothetical protein